MKLRHTWQVALCTAGLFTMAAAPAMAANTAAIIMGPLVYTLEDLAPEDGIAPELTWLSRKSEVSLFSYEGQPLSPPPTELHQAATGIAEPGTVSLSHAGSIASLSPAGAALEIKIPSGASTAIQALASEFSEYTLTANTRVRFFADAVAEIELDSVRPQSKYQYRGIAMIEQGGHDGSSQAIALDRIFAGDLAPKVSGTPGLNWSALNASGETAVLSVNPRIRVVMDNVAVVPEPAAMAQALAGLVSVAVAAGLRRRRRLHTTRG